MVSSSCKDSAKSGRGKRVNRPSSSIALAPATISSAGWAMNIKVPFHWSFRPRSVFANHGGKWKCVAPESTTN